MKRVEDLLPLHLLEIGKHFQQKGHKVYIIKGKKSQNSEEIFGKKEEIF